MANVQSVGESYKVVHGSEPTPVFPGNGTVKRAAPSVSVNKGYVPPVVYPHYDHDIYAYPGSKHGMEKIFQHTRVPESDNVVSQDLDMRAAKRAYIKEKRAIGGVFVAIGVAVLLVAAAFLIIKYVI